MKWQKVFFQNSRGLLLAGLLCGGPGNTRGVIINCHGFTGSKEGGGRALEMGEELVRQGWACLVFDFAGNGESEGNFADLTLSGQIDDLTCAVSWALEQGFCRVVTVGRSFGGTTAICQGARDPRVAGVCTWAAPARPWELFYGLTDEPLEGPAETVALASEGGLIYLKKDFFFDLRQYDVPRCASLLAPRPLLVIHGTRDNLVPPEDARLIYEAAREPREVVLLEGADHRFSQHHRMVWDALFDWLSRHFAA